MGAMLVLISSITFFYLIEKKKYYSVYTNSKDDSVEYIDNNVSINISNNVLSTPIVNRENHLKVNANGSGAKSGSKRNTYGYGV